jgi:hypothetical protein
MLNGQRESLGFALIRRPLEPREKIVEHLAAKGQG